MRLARGREWHPLVSALLAAAAAAAAALMIQGSSMSAELNWWWCCWARAVLAPAPNSRKCIDASIRACTDVFREEPIPGFRACPVPCAKLGA